MRTIITTLLVSFLFISNYTFAQKVDIDKFSIPMEYCLLPEHKVDASERTYSLYCSGDWEFDHNEIANAINLRGWTWVEQDGNVDVQIKIQDFVRGRATSSKRVVENKDKEGNVTSRTTYYKYTSTNTGRAYMNIYGPSNSLRAHLKAQKPKKKTKAQLRKEERERKKAEEKAKNPFLANVDSAEEEEVVSEKDKVAHYDLTQSYTVSGSEGRTVKAALDQYNRIAALRYSEQRDNYSNNVIRSANKSLNATYGYRKKSLRVRFKELDSKKHPEYEMFGNATAAMKEIFKQKKFNKPFDEVISNLEPIMGYFESVAEKYNSKDKHDKRLRAAALYNLAQMYYYLDQPSKCKEVGEEFVRWGYEKRDGERFIKKADDLAEKLAFHEVSGRYFNTEENSDDLEADEIAEDSEEE